MTFVEWTFGVQSIGVVKPVVGVGAVVDVGARLNSALRPSDKSESARKLEKEVSKLAAPVEDVRSDRCKECAKHVDKLFNAGADDRKCKGLVAAEQEECAFVLADINDYLGTTRVKDKDGKYLTFKAIVQNGITNNDMVLQFKKEAEKECKLLGSGANYCRHSFVCRRMGISCAAPGSIGVPDNGDNDDGDVIQYPTIESARSRVSTHKG